MADVSGAVNMILSGYQRLLEKYREQVTGNPVWVQGLADKYRRQAGTVRSVADAVTARSTKLSGDWEATEQLAFHKNATGLAGNLTTDTEAALRQAANRLTGAAAALTTARQSVDAEITHFEGRSKVLLTAARSIPDNQVQALLDGAKQTGAGAARTAQRTALDLGKALAALFGLPAPKPFEQFGPNNPAVVAVIGNSYGAGEGASKYYDARDRRHRSPYAAALQALEQVQKENSSTPLEVHFGASSGAVTRDVVTDQTYDLKMRDGTDRQVVINEAQLFQIPRNADLVVADFGGNDALFGPVVKAAHHIWDEPAEFTKHLAEADKLLSDRDETGRLYTAEDYRNQARDYPVGKAPTVVANWLQVIDEVRERAPDARILIPNYPDGVDPAALDAGFDPVTRMPREGSHLLSAEQGRIIEDRLLNPLNRALQTVADIAGPGVMVGDVSGSLNGHEVYTSDPYVNDLAPIFSGRDGRYENTWPQQEPFHPNDRGYGAMAGKGGMGKDIADMLGLDAPPIPPDGTVTPAESIRVIQGIPDIDGDGIANNVDPTPGNPADHIQGRVR